MTSPRCFNNGSGRDNRDVDNLMAVNPLDIDSSTSCLEYTSVATTDSTIGSAINEGAMFDAGVSVVVNILVYIPGAIHDTIDINFFGFMGTRRG